MWVWRRKWPTVTGRSKGHCRYFRKKRVSMVWEYCTVITWPLDLYTKVTWMKGMKELSLKIPWAENGQLRKRLISGGPHWPECTSGVGSIMSVHSVVGPNSRSCCCFVAVCLWSERLSSFNWRNAWLSGGHFEPVLIHHLELSVSDLQLLSIGHSCSRFSPYLWTFELLLILMNA